MPISRSRTFRSGNSEAVRLPEDVAFGEDVEVVLIRAGDVLTMYPARMRMTIPAMVAALNALSPVSAIEEQRS